MVHHGKLTFPIGYNNDTEERGTRNEERENRFSYLSKDITKFILELHSLVTRRTAYVRTRCYYRCKEAKCSKEN